MPITRHKFKTLDTDYFVTRSKPTPFGFLLSWPSFKGENMNARTLAEREFSREKLGADFTIFLEGVWSKYMAAKGKSYNEKLCTR
jgi:hypothetical protein